MAEFIDERPEEEEHSQVDDLQEEQVVEEEQQEDEELPEQYRGKSVKDLVRMHQEVQSVLGRQGNEVGQLRKVVDDFIKAQTVQHKPPEEEVDFFADPDKAIQKAIERHPKVQQAEMMAQQMKQTTALNTLNTKHPDYKEVINNNNFAQWVMGSKVRQELFRRADKQFDVDAADELISNWKERNQVAKQTAAVEQQARKQAIKQASTGSSTGSGESASKKVYRRSDIIDLMQRDPDRYMALSDDIMLAYAEGRVK